jgi:hypothetical protein
MKKIKKEESFEEQLKSFEEKLLNPEVRNSKTELTELIADGFIEFGCSGKIYDKQLVIESLQSEDKSKISIIDFFVTRLAEDVVLLTYGAVRNGQDGVKSYSLRSSIWKMIDKKWKIVFHQGTAINS